MNSKMMTKKYIKIVALVIIFLSISFTQTGIITSKGFQGFGIWGKINKGFTGDHKTFYDLTLEYYAPFGLEIGIGRLKQEKIRPWSRFSLGHHIKMRIISVELLYSYNVFNDQIYKFDFDDKVTFDEYSIITYYTSKLNPFIKVSKKSGYVNNSNSIIDNISIGGLGRITRFITFSCSINLPIEDEININNAQLETSFGVVY